MNDDLDPTALTLDEYQRRSAATDIDANNADPIVPLLGLAGEIGALIAEYKKKIRPDGAGYVGFDEVIRIELGDILWYLASLTSKSGLTLGEIAVANLAKTRARWLPGDSGPPTSYDDGMPDGQRLPRRFEAVFTTYVKDGLTKCSMTIGGEEFGDPIDDNTRYEDSYRFHDVFHLSHAAILGWSPVLRLLVSRKRRDDDRDRTEDGARAIAAEESVTAMVFAFAERWNYFSEAEHVDETILNAAKAVTSRLEVGGRTSAEWERAILAGYAVWRDLRDNNGGRIIVDLDTSTIEYAPV
jgi:hypothetical protein